VKGGVLHVSVEEATRDLGRVLSHVEGGGMAVIERDSRPVALLSPPEPARRSIDECLAALGDRAGLAADPGFAADIEEIIKEHSGEGLAAWE
jgi:antitoxin (DNA-binding transcriptional repressor) of toxin-antitoxin stability system